MPTVTKNITLQEDKPSLRVKLSNRKSTGGKSMQNRFYWSKHPSVSRCPWKQISPGRRKITRRVPSLRITSGPRSIVNHDCRGGGLVEKAIHVRCWTLGRPELPELKQKAFETAAGEFSDAYKQNTALVDNVKIGLHHGPCRDQNLSKTKFL